MRILMEGLNHNIIYDIFIHKSKNIILKRVYAFTTN